MIFVDTWGWITLACREEPRFDEVRRLYARLPEEGRKPLTTNFVLDETITLLFQRAPFKKVSGFFTDLFQSIQRGHILLETVGPSLFEKAWQMRLKYDDKPKISFTDLTSFVVMKERGIRQALTDDHHFLEVNLGFDLVP